MEITHWVGLCAVVSGMGVMLMDVILEKPNGMVWASVDTDLKIMGGAVALVGLLTIVANSLERGSFARGKGESR